MTSFFITGTDTNIGKTVTSALLLHHASKIWSRVHYFKPIQTGIESDCDASLVKRLSPDRETLTTSRGLGLKKPISPHLAAHYANDSINLESVVTSTKIACTGHFNLVEGAGGVLVPLNKGFFIIDLIKALQLPAILVVHSGLGTINHTLLSLEALRRRHITIQGIVMVGERNRDNEESISFYGRVANVLAVPLLPVIDRAALACLADTLAPELESLLTEKKHEQ